ncbi:MAG: corrinoid protein [Spirochaetia bacterium]|jgi:corrinoid protein of di/trimethylamine methyltransferase|nr:corrinoid protein [Spirochaetia bacterium]
MADFEKCSQALQKGQAKEVVALVQEAIDEGIDAKTILEEGLMSGMSIIGVKFKNNEVFVPEVLIAARAMNMGAALLKPLLMEAGVKAKGKAILGTVKGDLHDIGKNLVRMMMEGKGIEVIDVGTDVAPEKYIAKAKEENANLICCSALLTTTMTQMENVVKGVIDEGMRDDVTIMIGGAPVTQNYCDSIGADIYSSDAATAAEVASDFFDKSA